LLHLDGRRRREARLHARRDRRARLQRGARSGARARLPGDAPAPARHRPRAPPVQAPGPPLSPDRRQRPRGERTARVSAFVGRFHPLLVHFPIAFLLLAGALELLALRRRTGPPWLAARFPLHVVAALAAG